MWEKVSKLSAGRFKTYTGVHRFLFDKMLDCVKKYHFSKRKSLVLGAKLRLSYENQLLLTLLYLREYRSQNALSVDYDISQSVVSRTIREVEEILLQSGEFSLPSRRALLQSAESTGSGENQEADILVTDVMETPTEHPKKNKK